MNITFKQIEPSLVWQNRAYRFYIASRSLTLSGPLITNSPRLFLGYQAIESALKSTLVFWDKSFDPISSGHSTNKMLKTYKNKVPKEYRILDSLPDCFTWTERYQSLTRYPRKDMFFLPVISNYLEILDPCFSEIIRSVPNTQWKPELCGTLKGKNIKELNCLRRRNSEMRNLRKHFNIKLRANQSR
jgi:HEPN domain-containing protein